MSEKNQEEKVVDLSKVKDQKKEKKKLTDCSKRELIKLVREQHQHIKSLQSDVEYVNGVNQANDLLVAAAMLTLDRKILRVPHAKTQEIRNNYVLNWERKDNKDMLFELETREDFEKRQAKENKGVKGENGKN